MKNEKVSVNKIEIKCAIKDSQIPKEEYQNWFNSKTLIGEYSYNNNFLYEFKKIAHAVCIKNDGIEIVYSLEDFLKDFKEVLCIPDQSFAGRKSDAILLRPTEQKLKK